MIVYNPVHVSTLLTKSRYDFLDSYLNLARSRKNLYKLLSAFGLNLNFLCASFLSDKVYFYLRSFEYHCGNEVLMWQ